MKKSRNNIRQKNRMMKAGGDLDMAELVYYDGTNYNALRRNDGNEAGIVTVAINNDKIKRVYVLKDRLDKSKAKEENSHSLFIDRLDREINKLCKATERNLRTKFHPDTPSSYYGPSTFGSKIRAKKMAEYIDNYPDKFKEVIPAADIYCVVYYSA